MNCPASGECWRYCYSMYFREVGYREPPPRDVLFLAGYVPAEMMPRYGIFAESIPLPGQEGGTCPELLGHGYADCREFAKWDRLRQRRELKRFANKNPRRAIPRDVRRMVAARDHWRCVYCGAQQNTRRADGMKVRCVVDHFVPLALGGDPVALENLVFACRPCNQEKGVDIWPKGKKISGHTL